MIPEEYLRLYRKSALIDDSGTQCTEAFTKGYGKSGTVSHAQSKRTTGGTNVEVPPSRASPCQDGGREANARDGDSAELWIRL